jgi:hypothetical protein
LLGADWNSSPKVSALARVSLSRGGDAYNPGGPEGAQPGEAKIDAFVAYDCTNESCEAALKSKIEWITEGLNKFGEWEAN